VLHIVSPAQNSTYKQ